MAEHSRYWWTRWLPLWAYMILIFALSSLPQGPTLPVAHLDKLLHFLAYGLLAFLMANALTVSRWSLLSGTPRQWAFIFGMLYALLDEIHQHWVPGRDASVFDLAADSLGLMAVLWAIRIPAAREEV